MSGLQSLVESLGELAVAVSRVGEAAFVVAANHWVAVAWIVFFLFVIRWPDVRATLRQGAWPAVFWLYFLISFTWGLCTEPSLLPYEESLGATGASLVEKFVLAALWLGVAFACGALQDHWRLAPAEVEIAGPPEGPAGGGHGGHGHDAHGHH